MITYNFHNAKTEPPSKDGLYLCITNYHNHPYYRLCQWANDLYKVDSYYFENKRGVHGWYDYDSEAGYYVCGYVAAWAELPEIPEEIVKGEQ